MTSADLPPDHPPPPPPASPERRQSEDASGTMEVQPEVLVAEPVAPSDDRPGRDGMDTCNIWGCLLLGLF